MNEDHPYAPPSCAATVPDHHDLPTARPGIRFFSSIIDMLIQLVVVTVISKLLVAAGAFPIYSIDVRYEEPVRFYILGLLVFFMVHWSTLSGSGQTIGKKLMKLKIVTMSGEKPPMTSLVLKRYGLFWVIAAIPSIGPIFSLINALFVFRRDHRCIHDWVAGTRVVNLRASAEIM